jgi:hypothetical protein
MLSQSAMVADNEPLSGAHFDEEDLNRLVNAIRLGIVIKGYYVVFDERLDLICENRKALQTREWAQAVQEFARRYGWEARLDDAGEPVEFLLGQHESNGARV